MLAYNPLSTLEDNLAAMEEVLPTVTTIEITQAVRDTSVDGVPVSLGDYIALLEDQLVLTATSAEEALERAVEQAEVGRERHPDRLPRGGRKHGCGERLR